MNRAFNYLILAILVIPPLIFFTDLTRNPYFFQIVLLNGLTVILWMAWLLKGLKEQSIAVPKTPLDFPLIAFFVVATISWILTLAVNFSDPYMKYSVFSEGFKRWLFLITNQILVFYAAYNFTYDLNRSKFVSAIFLVGFLSSFYGVIQYFGIEPIWPRVLNPFGGRSVSTFGNPTFLSSYIILIFPVAFIYYLTKRNYKPIYFVLLLTLFAGLLCTLTRSSWGGIFASAVVFLLFLGKFEKQLLFKKKKVIGAIFGIFLFMVIFWPKSSVEGYNPTIFERVFETAQARDGYYAPWHQRKLIWSCAWSMVNENPFLGKGWGCFELFYPFYQGRHLFLDVYKNFRTHANNAHDEILEIWSQTGTIGFGIYLLILAVLFRYAYLVIKNYEGEKRYLAIGLVSATAGMLADNLLNVSINFPIPGFLYWWNLGILVGLGGKQLKIIKTDNSIKKTIILILLFFGIFIIVRYTRDFLAEIHFFNGFKASRGTELNRAVKELEISHKYRRLEVNNNYELANAYARIGMPDKAINYYKEALRSNAGYDEIYFNMANMLNQKGEKENAIDEYSRSLFINPVTKEGYIALAGIFLQNPDFYARAGIKVLEQSVIFFPNDKDIWNNLGFLYAKVNDNEKALKAYKKALEIDPDFIMARKNIEITLLKLNRKDDFLNKVDTLFAQAEQNIQKKNWQNVLNISEKLVEIVPKSFKANLYLANAYFTVGKLDKAVESYKKALEMEPSNPTLLGNLGLAYYQEKKFKLAKKTFEDLIKVEPKNALARQKIEELGAITYGQE